MKKSCKLLLLGTAVAASLTVSAAAADFTHCADALNEMDLFSGTENGYELDRAPTRAEAAVMLVRLLGGAQDAEANTYETPFTDVPAWAQPYVGWLYENNLTAGATDTTYDPNGACTAQMYSTFLLRSLGYTDSGDNADFTYNDALNYATEVGVVDAVNCDADNFLRDDVVAMSYTTLATQPKSGDYDTLLDQLVADGAVDATKAQATQATFSAYREYMALSEDMASLTDMAMAMTMNMDMQLNGANLMNANVDMDVAANMDLNSIDASKMSMNGTMTITLDESLATEGAETEQTMNMEAYFTDGAYYMNMDGTKYKMDMSFDDMLADLNLDTMTAKEPISLFESIVKNEDGSYAINYASDSMNSMITNILEMAGMTADVGTVAIDNVSITVTPENGEWKSMSMSMDMGMTIEDQTIDMTVSANYEITETGEGVVVTLPDDLDTYQDISSLVE